MFSQIFRSFIHNGVHYGSKINSSITGHFVKSLQSFMPQSLSCGSTTQNRNFMSNSMSSWSIFKQISNEKCASTSLLQTNINSKFLQNVPTRTIVKYSRDKGKRLPNREVLKRFYRLNWGIWIRTKAGKNRRRWRKRASNLKRSRQHVFCNSTQSYLLDKMVTKEWRRPTYFVDDPYNSYHQREEFWITRTKPAP